MVIVANTRPAKTYNELFFNCTMVLNKQSLFTVDELRAIVSSEMHDIINKERMDFFAEAVLLKVEFHRDDIVSIVRGIENSLKTCIQNFFNKVKEKFEKFKSKVRNNGSVIGMIQSAIGTLTSTYNSSISQFSSTVNGAIAREPMDLEILTNELVDTLWSGADTAIDTISQKASSEIDKIVSHIESAYRFRIDADDIRPDKEYSFVTGDETVAIVF